MSDAQSYKRYPAIRCWIKHIIESTYNNQEKAFFTIFGKVKRARILGTVMDKREILNTAGQEEDLDDEDSNSRVEFDLDDTTGQMRATVWNTNPEDYDHIQVGDIVDVVGLLRKWNEYPYISPEIIKKVENPNFILLRNAEIIKRIKFGELQEIPEAPEEDWEIDEFEEQIDINELFEGDDSGGEESIKNKIYALIEQHSMNGRGVSLEQLKEQVKIPEDQLRKLVQDLVMESKIYQSDENIYESY